MLYNEVQPCYREQCAGSRDKESRTVTIRTQSWRVGWQIDGGSSAARVSRRFSTVKPRL